MQILKAIFCLTVGSALSLLALLKLGQHLFAYPFLHMYNRHPFKLILSIVDDKAILSTQDDAYVTSHY